MEKKTLRELVQESNADCVMYIDAGNGSGGASLVEWTSEIDDEYGDTELMDAPAKNLAYDDGTADTIADIAVNFKLVNYRTEGRMWVSDWIIDGDGDNPYRYRIIF